MPMFPDPTPDALQIPSYAPPAYTAPQVEAYSLEEIEAAAFRLSNSIASVLSDPTSGLDNTPMPGYSPWTDIKDTPYEQNWSVFTNSNNPGYTAAVKRRIDQEKRDKQVLAASTLANLWIRR